MILFKHLMKLIKQLTNIKQNGFKLPHWDAFKQTNKCKYLMATFGEYCEKYEKEYLKHLKEANIIVIKEINQKFSELGSAEPLSLSFYRKVQSLMGLALKDCLMSPYLQLGEQSQGYMQGVRCLMQYFKWIECNTKNYENYVLQRSLGVQVIKNFKNGELSNDSFGNLV